MLSNISNYASEQRGKVRKIIKKGNFLRDGASRFFLVTASVANVVCWLLAFSKIRGLPEPVILHYNAYFGIDVNGSSAMVFLLPGAGLLVLIVNLVLGAYFAKKDLIITRVIVATSLLFNLLVNLAMAALIFVNNA